MKLLLLALTLSATPGPTSILKEADEKMRTLARGPQATTAGFATLAESYIDFPELSKRSLGDEWKRLPENKRAEFVKTMFSVLCTSYASKALVEGKKENLIKYQTEDVSGNEATVRSSVRGADGDTLVVFKLFRANSGKNAGTWKLFDVVTDDVSLLEGYRDEFRQIISKKGFDGLLESLKSKQRQQAKNGSSC